MDLTTITGLIIECIVLANAAGGNLGNILYGFPLIIVILGGIAATLVAYPFRSMLIVPALKTKGLVAGLPPHTKTVQMMVGMAETARREGILALESAARESGDEFAKTGIRLAVDGTEPELIQAILETELVQVEQRHRFAHELLRTLGNNYAIFGGVAALILFVVNPSNTNSGLELVSQVAQPVLYGTLLYLFLSVGIRRKHISASEHECLQKRMVIEGVMSIQSGDNPRIVEQKLNVFLSPRHRSRTAPAKEPKSVSPPIAEEVIVNEDLVESVGKVMQQLKDSISTYNTQPRELSLKA